MGYSCLSQRRGIVLSEEPIQGTPLVMMKAYLPVAESFGFTQALRAATSGRAFPQCSSTIGRSSEEILSMPAPRVARLLLIPERERDSSPRSHFSRTSSTNFERKSLIHK